MKIYDNGELVHIDSSKDVLLHYGRKGMKWGVRNSIRNVRDRWNNLPEKRRRRIKAVAKAVAMGAGIVGYHYTKGKLDPYIRAQIVKMM
jgi:hypothetical protein